MIRTLDMRFMRYANLFSKITKIKTNHCFEYNSTIVFAVPRRFIMQSIGIENKNLKKLNEIIGKRIKIIAIPHGKEDIENFVSVLIYPVRFRAIEVNDNIATISASQQSKASLIGRGKVHLNEMENILGQYFGIRKLRVK